MTALLGVDIGGTGIKAAPVDLGRGTRAAVNLDPAWITVGAAPMGL